MNQTTTPVIENVNVREQSVQLSAEMMLASVLVRVSGTYNVHNNTYYPSGVTELGADRYEIGESYDLESYCEKMGWDYFDTQEAIQEAVEKRDQ